MNISFAKPSVTAAAALVVVVAEGRKFARNGARLDTATDGALSRAMTHSRFQGKPGQVLTVMAPAGLEAGRVVLIGVGEPGYLQKFVPHDSR